MKYSDELWEILGYVIAVVLVLSILLGFWLPKTHQGYYLNAWAKDSTLIKFKIYNNWRLWPDEIAYTTYDKEEAIKTLKELQEISK